MTTEAISLSTLPFQITRVCGKDWCTYRKRNNTLDIGLRKIVIRNYRGNKSHINLARFFVSNARLLESIAGAKVNTKWIGTEAAPDQKERFEGCSV